MGQDGAKVVVVNSLGREIRTLEEVPPTEGKRLQLTIDYDLQKAVEDGFKRSHDARLTNAGAAVVLDPEHRRSAGVHQRAGLRPERVCRGHRSRDVGVAQQRRAAAAQRPRAAGPLFARLDVQDGRGAGRARGGRHHARLQGELQRRRQLLRPLLQVLAARAATARSICGTPSSSRATSTSTPSPTCWASTRSTSGRRCSAWASRAASICRTKSRGWCRPPSGSGCTPRHEKWYAGETISVGIGQGAVSVTPVSMAVYMATLANGGTRVTPHLLKAVDDGNGWKPVPAPTPQSQVDIDPGQAAGDPRRHVDGRQRRAAPAAARGSPGYDVVGQDRHARR